MKKPPGRAAQSTTEAIGEILKQLFSHCKRKVLLGLIWLQLKHQRRITRSAKTSPEARKVALRQTIALVRERAELWTDADLKRAERRRGLV